MRVVLVCLLHCRLESCGRESSLGERVECADEGREGGNAGDGG